MSNAPGGQAGSSSLIENFFGFPTGVSGGDLTYRAQLLNSHLANEVREQERTRGTSSVTYSQIVLAEALYRRGVDPRDISADIEDARIYISENSAPAAAVA